MRKFLLLTIFCLVLIWPISSVKAVVNPALVFDGISNYVLLPQINAGSVFTLECWFYIDGDNLFFPTLFADSYTLGTLGSIYGFYDTENNSNSLEWWYQGEWIHSMYGLESRAWYYLSFIGTGTDVEFYLNGYKRASINQLPVYNNDLEWGKADNANYWGGKIDEIRLYNRALSSTEVAEHYNWTFSNESGLLGLWHFNEGSGGVTTDSSGNGNDGIIYGATWGDGPTVPEVPDEVASTVTALATAPTNYLLTLNNPPNAQFVKWPEETTWGGIKKINYEAFDPDGSPNNLKNNPINFYYSADNGLTWKEIVRSLANKGFYDLDSSKIPDGRNYKLKMVVEDNGGRSTSIVSDQFSVDNDGPTFSIKINSPAKIIKENDTIGLEITVSEDLKKAPFVQIIQENSDPQAVEITGSGNRFSGFYTVRKSYVGIGTITIAGEDLAGNSGNVITSGKSFAINRLGPPPPVLGSPIDKEIFSEPNISVSGNAPLAEKVEMLFNGVDKRTVIPDKDGNFIFNNIILSLANEGYNIISVSSFNKEGFRSDEVVSKVKLNTPPVIKLVNSPVGILSNVFNLNWVSSDANRDSLNYSLEYSLDSGKTWGILNDKIKDNKYDFHTQNLFDGDNYVIRIVADDGAAKSFSVSDKFGIKNGFDFSFFGIPQNILINENSPVFTGIVKTPGSKLISLKYDLGGEDQENALPTDGRFDSEIENFTIRIPKLVDGKYNINIEAKDDSENVINWFKAFIIDTLPPVSPTIISPRPEENIDSQKDLSPDPGIQINVTGKAESGAELIMEMNNKIYKTVAGSDGKFVFTKVTLYGNGINKYVITSYDATGNYSKIDGYVVTNNAPKVRIISPESGDFVGGVYEITWSGSDPDDNPLVYQVFYRRKGGEWLLLGEGIKTESFKWNVPKKTSGPYEVKIVVGDGLSFGESTVNFLIDNTAPEIILDKEGDLFFNNPRFVLKGMAKDDFSGVKYVEYSFAGDDWENALIVEGRQSQTAKFEYSRRTLLEDGSYKVETRVTDVAGNVGYSEPRNLFIDTTPPSIGSFIIASGALIVLPDNDAKYNIFSNLDYDFSASASADTESVELTVGTEKYLLVYDRVSTLWHGKLNFKEVGEQKMVILAKDKAGNNKSKIIDIKVLSPGYVYDLNSGDKISGAEISLFIFDSQANNWILWGASALGQINPQVSGKDGQYKFFVTPGKYKIKVSAKGYETAETKGADIANNFPFNAVVPLAPKKGLWEMLLRLF